MWRQRDRERDRQWNRRKGARSRSPKLRMDQYGGPTRKYSPNRRGEFGDVMKKARKEGGLYWMERLLEAEEKDPSRWGHSGFKELYLEKDQSKSKSRSRSKSRSPFRPAWRQRPPRPSPLPPRSRTRSPIRRPRRRPSPPPSPPRPKDKLSSSVTLPSLPVRERSFSPSSHCSTCSFLSDRSRLSDSFSSNSPSPAPEKTNQSSNPVPKKVRKSSTPVPSTSSAPRKPNKHKQSTSRISMTVERRKETVIETKKTVSKKRVKKQKTSKQLVKEQVAGPSKPKQAKKPPTPPPETKKKKSKSKKGKEKKKAAAPPTVEKEKKLTLSERFGKLAQLNVERQRFTDGAGAQPKEPENTEKIEEEKDDRDSEARSSIGSSTSDSHHGADRSREREYREGMAAWQNRLRWEHSREMNMEEVRQWQEWWSQYQDWVDQYRDAQQEWERAYRNQRDLRHTLRRRRRY